MSYELKKPYSEKQKADFIVEYNHNKGLKIEETETSIFALEYNEVMKDGVPVIDLEYEAKQAEERKKTFESAFFATSLGWIRRNVSMKDGSTKSFLTDLLPQLVVGIPVLAYSLPDFTKEVEIVNYQKKVVATEQFIQECKNQLYADFYGAMPDL